MPGNQVLAVGQCNFEFAWTENAWHRGEPEENPTGFVRVYSAEFDLLSSTALPGVIPAESVTRQMMERRVAWSQPARHGGQAVAMCCEMAHGHPTSGNHATRQLTSNGALGELWAGPVQACPASSSPSHLFSWVEQARAVGSPAHRAAGKTARRASATHIVTDY